MGHAIIDTRMNRRKLLAVAGGSLGLAGCLANADTDTAATLAQTQKQNGGGNLDVSFESCTRAAVTGSFEQNDVAFANTGFYDKNGLYGNTLLENGIVFGEDVEADFTGTVVFEICRHSPRVEEYTDVIIVKVPDYGSNGTVIESLTTRRDDYRSVSATHGNPHAQGCLNEMKQNGGGSDNTNNDNTGNNDDPENGNNNGSEGTAEFKIPSISPNTPIPSGQDFRVDARIQNTGNAEGTRTVRLRVGDTPQQVDSTRLTLAPGESKTVTLGYTTPQIDNDDEFPIRVNVGDEEASQIVLVRGT